MKNKIINVSILLVLILIMLPSVSSLQFNIYQETSKSFLYEKIKDMDINEFIVKIEDNSSPLLFGIILKILIRIIGFLLITTFIAYIIYLYVSNIINPPDQ